MCARYSIEGRRERCIRLPIGAKIKARNVVQINADGDTAEFHRPPQGAEDKVIDRDPPARVVNMICAGVALGMVLGFIFGIIARVIYG